MVSNKATCDACGKPLQWTGHCWEHIESTLQESEAATAGVIYALTDEFMEVILNDWVTRAMYIDNRPLEDIVVRLSKWGRDMEKRAIEAEAESRERNG